MVKVLIHYFSGTGNSLLAAKQLSNELEEYGYEATFHAIENGLYDTTQAYSLHIFFFPVFATAVPHIMRRYICSIPSGKNVRTAVISTNGKVSTHFRDGYQGWALYQARLYLGIKKYNVIYSTSLDYPHNITVAIPPRKSLYNTKIIEQVSLEIPKIAEQIANGKVFHRKIFIPNIIWSLPFGIVYSLVGRRVIGKLFTADNSCTSCGLCAERCPVDAIVKEPHSIRWKWNCEGCLRCINSCPKHAVQTSVVRILAVILAMSVNLFNFIVPAVFINSLGSTGASIFNFCTGVISFILVIYLADWILKEASYIPVLKRIIGLGFTQLYGRYNAKDFEDKFIIKNKSR